MIAAVEVAPEPIGLRGIAHGLVKINDGIEGMCGTDPLVDGLAF